MKVAIMQPYFLPYIGYFQLISAVDRFIVYDNIKYTKKGWINRNRMLMEGKDVVFSLPLKAASDYLHVRQREIATDFNRINLLNKFKGAYRSAPYFAQVFPLIEQIMRHEDTNLFNFLFNSIAQTCAHLGITTTISISSSVTIDHSLKGEEKVLALCEAVGGSVYVNAIGGTELYSKIAFSKRNIDLKFIHSKIFQYPQFDNVFVPWLSIIDVLMFNRIEHVRTCISNKYELI